MRAVSVMTGWYVLAASLWILVSDQTLALLIQDAQLLNRIQSAKGLAFVAATGLLLLGLLTRDAKLRRQVELESQRLLERLRAEREEAQALTALIASLTGSLDADEMLQRAVEALPRLLDGSCAGIAVPDGSGGLSYRATVGISEQVREQLSRAPCQDLLRRVYTEGILVRSRDLTSETALHGTVPGARAFLAAPLQARGRTLGVIAVASSAPDAFDRYHEALLTNVAHYVAAALAAAQFWAETSRQAAQTVAILEQMAEAVLVADEQGRVVLVNEAACALYAESRETILGRTIGQQRWQVFDLSEAPVPLERRLMSRALRGESCAGEYKVRCSDGAERQVWASAVPLRNGDGAVVGGVLLSRDVGEERNRQRLATQTEKLQTLGQMASGVAHDLNQYLGLVAGHAELASRMLDAPEFDRAQLREAVRVVAQAALDGGEVVQRLLLFARPSRQEGEPSRIQLESLLDEVAKLTAPRWRDAAQRESRPIRLEMETHGETVVVGWPTALREALTNLVFNAVDAMPAGGAIRLVAERVGEQVQLRVSDEGTGMSPEVRARVFEPFFTTKGERGTGLGLPMVYAVVSRHGGELELETATGQGTTFILTLPAAQGEPPPVAPEGDEAAASPLRVLLVEDEVALGQMAARILALDGHDVTLATTGEQAYELLERGEFDLVVSDIGLVSGMNVWELAERVRQRWPDLPFTLATGWGAQIDPAEAATRGVDAVVSKPYRLVDLRRLTRLRRPIRQAP